jgi:nucleoside-diphosphate-sugar epimerase
MARLVAVTGASGFIGRVLVPLLLQQGFRVRASARNASAAPPATEFVLGDLRDSAVATRLASGADVVVHLGGQAHVEARDENQRRVMFDVNVGATVELARLSAATNVQQFVFASSIGVLGARLAPGSRLTEASPPDPQGDYGRSKLAAEHELVALSKSSGMPVTIVRPTLVFGPGAPGNVSRLVRLVASGLPLPFGRLDARRSFVGVRSLSELLAICCTRQLTAANMFVAADQETFSLPEVVRLLADGLNRPARLWPLPRTLLTTLAGMAGRSGDLTRIAAPLVVDASKARSELGWNPQQTLADAIRETATSFAVAAAGLDPRQRAR